MTLPIETPPPGRAGAPPDGRLKRARCLFLTFLKIGAFTFGGGYAMLPLIEREVVANRRWATHEEVLDMFAIGQAAPGVIALNVATFLGFRVGGFLGAAAAVVGVALPSVLIISAIAIWFDQITRFTWMQHAFAGVRAGVLVLIIGAIRKLSKPLKATTFNFVVGVAAFAATAFFKVGAAWLILTAVAIGLFADLLARPSKEAKNA